ncbi:MAG: Nif3-like dinuclear metal center hexameric protein [Verrucomicrobiota bacterium]|jgi:dinuclear metal center YbgI/SA1388 family protein|nr:Nif3-like dinuclear metal center hexameric protein [Verrucomicrobiota bacterium]MDP7049726.1 Nif3-like dinuclear metal center hexameric protein [Verrucomicrobiota bacterium]
MARAKLANIVTHCNHTLKPELFEDWPAAVNGLQVQNRGNVSRIAAAVDATPATVKKAIDAGADLLIVHHGLFWRPTHPWTGNRYKLLRLLLDNNIAVYSSHLPLDAHPRLGNNAQLCKALGIKTPRPFFSERGQKIGLRGTLNLTRRQLAKRLAKSTGSEPTLLPGGGVRCRRVGVVTGGAGAEMKTAADEGVDTFITGEGPHWTFALAEDLDLNVFYGGHYATETFGVKALSEHLSKKFNLPWTFIDHPTGL